MTSTQLDAKHSNTIDMIEHPPTATSRVQRSAELLKHFNAQACMQPTAAGKSANVGA